jgi:cellulose synthase/poly-beta-1,6-N-acetylglucosamine synthase-like glycosyltransferase
VDGEAAAVMSWLFWGALGTLAHIYLIFPLLVVFRGLFLPKRLRQVGGTPSVTFVIAAHNEAPLIGAKLENTLALDYPSTRLEVIVASDGSDDGTNEILAAARQDGLQVLVLPRMGKNQVLNEAVLHARGDILVFSDVDCHLGPTALRHLVKPFADDRVGAVGGRLVLTGEHPGRLRHAMRRARHLFLWLESRGGSITTGDGRLIALRRSVFKQLPDGVNDDFHITLQAILAGRRIVFEPLAEVYSVAATPAVARFSRKVRVLRRMFRTVWLERTALNPAVSGFYALQLLSHKVLRRLIIVPLVVLGISGVWLWPKAPIYRLVAVSQALLHAAALLGWFTQGSRADWLVPLRSAFAFDVANVAALRAMFDLVRGAPAGRWTPQRADRSPTARADPRHAI